ncbi:MAG: hypothetical protein ISS82_05940 [Nanoarchaeota archaeon]|nr:hypothetical protein [Nanoarchaeota archaeon]
MIIYNPHNKKLLERRIKKVQNLIDNIPVKYCFVTGSFIYKNNYEDIDIFVITRAKRRLKIHKFHKFVNKIKINIIDFNDLYSLFYHSVSKSCVSKNILPVKPLKVTISDYWHVINEAIPTILNQKNKYHKDIRFLVLYTEFFKTGNVLDTFQLNQKINQFKDYKEILKYIQKEVPVIINENMKKSYIKRFFYTQAGFYRKLLDYKAQNFLYNLTHTITKYG